MLEWQSESLREDCSDSEKRGNNVRIFMKHRVDLFFVFYFLEMCSVFVDPLSKVE